MKFRLDQTLIVEAGLLSINGDSQEIHGLLAAYEDAASTDDFEFASQAENALRHWVSSKRKRKWSCGEACKAGCEDLHCQFNLGF